MAIGRGVTAVVSQCRPRNAEQLPNGRGRNCGRVNSVRDLFGTVRG